MTADTSDFDDKMAEAQERLRRLAEVGAQAATGFTEVVSAAEDFEQSMRQIAEQSD